MTLSVSAIFSAISIYVHRISSRFGPTEHESRYCLGQSSHADVYHHPAPYGVLPFENTIHGSVIETLDLLLSVLGDISGSDQPSSSSSLSLRAALIPQDNYDDILTATSSAQSSTSGTIPSYGNRGRIISEMRMPIRHCLVAKRGVRLEDITVVRSHEQVSLSQRGPVRSGRRRVGRSS